MPLLDETRRQNLQSWSGILIVGLYSTVKSNPCVMSHQRKALLSKGVVEGVTVYNDLECPAIETDMKSLNNMHNC